MFKKILQSFLLILFSAVFALFLAECGFRFFIYRPAAKAAPQRVLVHEASDNLKLLYKPSPGMVNEAYGVTNSINSSGFRDREFPVEKPAGVTRMIFLGDSVVYGYGIEAEDTLPKQLEQRFREKGKPVEVLNMGVSGYDSEQQVEFFKETGLKFHPDTVIVGYTLNDSIYASMELDFFHDKLDHQIREERTEFRKRFLSWLIDYSSVLSFFNERVDLKRKWKLYRSRSVWHMLEDRNRKNKDLPESAYAKLEAEIKSDAAEKGTSPAALKKMLGVLGFGNDDMWSSHWNVSEAAFLELKQLSQKHGFKVIVVIFPFNEELDHYAIESAHRFLTQSFRGMGFQVIDPLAFCKTQLLENKVKMFADWVHFTAEGTRILSQYLLEQLLPQ